MGFILLFLVYMIPTEPMIENARASIDIFKIEGAFAQNIHGYLTVLKPLLYLFDYGDIRGILKFTGLALLIWICVFLEKIHMSRFIPAFVAAMACMEFHTIGMSMQYTWVFIISMSFSIYILKKTQGIKKKQVTSLLFLVIGMTTSYFDFLTYPLFALGIPLLFWTICMKGTENEARLLLLTVKNSVYWAAGYIGMWVEKWILCTILTGENLFADAMHSVMIRSGSNVSGKTIGYWDVVYKNIMVIAKYPYVLAVLAAAVIIFFVCGTKCTRGVSKEAFLTYLYIAALPFGWYMISVNHSYIHSFMTYKSLSITVFALLCAWSEMKCLIKAHIKTV